MKHKYVLWFITSFFIIAIVAFVIMMVAPESILWEIVIASAFPLSGGVLVYLFLKEKGRISKPLTKKDIVQFSVSLIIIAVWYWLLYFSDLSSSIKEKITWPIVSIILLLPIILLLIHHIKKNKK
ncbi:MAG: hypothetical protein IJ578_06850 [Bacteroidales bacterium]|nr:hypothetical protein [Bacteroidales bacterium]